MYPLRNENVICAIFYWASIARKSCSYWAYSLLYFVQQTVLVGNEKLPYSGFINRFAANIVKVTLRYSCMQEIPWEIL